MRKRAQWTLDDVDFVVVVDEVDSARSGLSFSRAPVH